MTSGKRKSLDTEAAFRQDAAHRQTFWRAKQYSKQRMKIAIIGPGAIGGTVAAWLSQCADYEVTVCCRSPFHSIHLDHANGSLEAHVQVATESHGVDAADWILVATKTYDAESASKWLPPLTHDSTQLAILQNGVEHRERFAPFFPETRIVPVVVDIPAERTKPGHIRQRDTGRMTVADDISGRSFAELFSHTPIPIVLTSDFLTAAWHKLCLNAAGVMSALTLRPAGVMHDAEIAAIGRGIVEECAAVGRAMGAELPDTIADWVIERYRQAPVDSVNSLHGDRLAGKVGEVDARHGVIVREGQRLGIPTPFNQMAYALLSLSPAPETR